MNTITICLNGQPAEEIEKMDGVISSVSWAALMPTISEMVRLRTDELIEGIVINDTDIRVKIGRKKGRKVNSVKPIKDL